MFNKFPNFNPFKNLSKHKQAKHLLFGTEKNLYMFIKINLPTHSYQVPTRLLLFIKFSACTNFTLYQKEYFDFLCWDTWLWRGTYVLSPFLNQFVLFSLWSHFWLKHLHLAKKSSHLQIHLCRTYTFYQLSEKITTYKFIWSTRLFSSKEYGKIHLCM